VQGLVYTIEKLGNALAEAELALQQAREENAVLRARVEQLEAGSDDPALRNGEGR
jgi:hypothetical protein